MNHVQRQRSSHTAARKSSDGRSDFDGLTRSLAQSRRSLLGGALALTGGRLGIADSAAGNKRQKKRNGKKKPRKLVLNQYGCVDVGQPCRGDSTNCCSGICEGVAPRKGKPDRSRCVAHNVSVCGPGSDLCSTGKASICNGSEPYRLCTLTTGNAGFCADFSPYLDAGTDASFFCRDCSRDTDCQAEFGPGAACVVYGGVCSVSCGHAGSIACMPAGD